MGFSDRPYYGPGQGGGGLRQWSMVNWLLAINAGVFILDSIVSGSQRGSFLSPAYWGHFSIELGIYKLQIWRWFTYQFIHANFMHILFNMIGLYFFGRLLEQWWGSRRFLAFYLLCGASGAFIFTALSYIPGLLNYPLNAPLVGASGSVFGILAGCAVLFPHQRVMLLIPPIPMSMRTMALLFLGIASLSIILGSANAGGEAAHLGGALLGYLLIKKPNLLGFADGGSGGGSGGGGMSGLSRIKESFDRRQAQRSAERDRERDAEIDRILAKVKENGLQSLTDKEQRLLREQTERQRRTG